MTVAVWHHSSASTVPRHSDSKVSSYRDAFDGFTSRYETLGSFYIAQGDILCIASLCEGEVVSLFRLHEREMC